MSGAHSVSSLPLIKKETGLFRPVFLCLFTLFFLPTSISASENTESLPVISIIIDDLGKRLGAGRRIVNLPGPVACSFLPGAVHTSALATAAHRAGKEVLLHLPMDTVDGRALDQGAVTLDMTEQQFTDTVVRDIRSIPHVMGVNNHMGSLLTRHPGHMHWLMRALRNEGGLLFVDSRTTAATVARKLAQENGLPNIERDVFLDNDVSPAAILAQFKRLIDLAHQQGAAVAIGHPYPQTLAVLEKQLPDLANQGVRLVTIEDFIKFQTKAEPTWQASSSPSLKAVRN